MDFSGLTLKDLLKKYNKVEIKAVFQVDVVPQEGSTHAVPCFFFVFMRRDINVAF